ncbi:fimbrial protein [Ferrimonas sediminicola]|uniref:Fimbrial protein n=1 Tax=Ferrimonas sediminicola TaxID=2569538 RepID=A0A4U1BAW9_9GAMM|nr:PilN domain-containing protein [Ferrimonas sediminicola]TKB48017.1 fimbrial protein [Ferrimonas sediminicola]
MSRINLLPWREALRRRQKRDTAVGLAGIAMAALLLVVLAHLLVGARVEAQRARNGYLQEQITLVEARIQQLGLIEQQTQQLMQRMGLIGRLQQERSRPVHLLNELHRVVVPGVQLSRLQMEGGHLSLAGYCESNNQLAELLRRVEASPWLEHPRVQRIRADDDGQRRRHRFELTLALRREAAE